MFTCDAWCTMVGIIGNTNSSNLTKMKLVKILNNLGITCIIVNTYCSHIQIINWLALYSNSLTLNMSNELVAIITNAIYFFCLSIFANITYIISLENKQLEISLIGLEPWVEKEIMLFNWENLPQVKIEKEKISGRCSHLYNPHP